VNKILTTVAVLTYVLCSPLRADEVPSPLEGYAYTSWAPRDGAPAAVRQVAQTTDDTLWLASERGLYSFDGVRFSRFEGTAAQPLPSDMVAAVYATPDGGLWMGFRLGGLAFLKNGVMTIHPPDGVTLPEATVHWIASDHDGTLWVTTAAGVSRYARGRWERVQGDWGLPQANAREVILDHAGTVWTRVADRLFYLPRGSHRFVERQISSQEGAAGVDASIVTGPDGEVWVGTLHGGVRPLNAPFAAVKEPKTSSEANRDSPMMVDRQGAIWHTDPSGIWRYTNPQEVLRGQSPHVERLDLDAEGPETTPFEDREGNIWVATYKGLGRLTPTSFRITMGNRYGMVALVTAADGTVWWSNWLPGMTSTSLFRIENDKSVQQLTVPDIVSCAYRDRDGTLWFAGRKALWHLESTGLTRVPVPVDQSGLDGQALARDGSGALWYSVQRLGVFRYADGKWQHNGNLPNLPGYPAITMTTDSHGRLWLGYTKGRLAQVDGHTVRMFGSGDGIGIGGITALTSHGNHLWVGGEHGLLYFDGVRFIPVRAPNDAAFRGLWGIVETASSELWVAATDGVIRLTHTQLTEVLENGASQQPARIFDFHDGLPGEVRSLRPLPAVVAAGDGKLWFSFTLGLAHIDPAHIVHNPLPPPVLITGISAADHLYPPLDHDIRLPVGTTQLRIAYTANSFTAPERVRFRYLLEGLDRVWQDAGDRREATYTNVGPGSYRFRVIAANNDGVWNLTGASLAFRVLPAFYQTAWFHTLCAIAAGALLYLLYYLRIRKITAAVRARLEARIDERERIARDLHDTLLQGLQGLILRFHTVASRIPRDHPAQQLMERVLTLADQVLVESRDRVKELRDSTDFHNDLAKSLDALGEELSHTHSAQLRIQVNGTQRKLHPGANDEVILIGREALTNAFQHARARQIEVEIEFARSDLRLRIRDDGKGIEPQVLESGGLPGHWGLRGMHERAEKIRARLHIWSRRGAGTELELRVPASIAYGHKKVVSLKWWPRKRVTALEHWRSL
jgi:signal transduction histidine kinase/ligand-binding sensor domain-containing protein